MVETRLQVRGWFPLFPDSLVIPSFPHIEANGAVEGGDFVFGEFAALSGLKITEFELAYLYAAQGKDGQVKVAAHAAYLSVHTLHEGHAEQVFVVELFDGNGHKFYPFGKAHTAPHDVEGLFGGLFAQADKVDFFKVVAGVGHAVGEFAVIGEDEQAFGKIVEPSNRVKAVGGVFFWQYIQHGGTVLGVFGSAYHLHGFVEHEVEGGGGLCGGKVNALAVNVNNVGCGVNFRALIGEGNIVDKHAALGDKVVSLPARADTGLGKSLVDADRRIHGTYLFISGLW